MKNKNTFMIIMLLFTASILGVMLIGSMDSDRASAANSGDRTFDRDYIMVTGQISKKTCILYVIHTPTRRIFAYVPDGTNKKLTLADVQGIQ